MRRSDGMQRAPKGLVVIPAFNEAEQIAGVIAQVREHTPDHDILVVDDCSTDGTASVARRAGGRVVVHPINLGDGAARQTGLKFARAHGYRHVVTVDGDGQHDPRSIPALIAPLYRGEADLVIGSRFRSPAGGSEDVAGGGARTSRYRTPWDRRFGMLLFAGLASILIRQRLTDTTSGFRAMNERAIALFCTSWFPQTYPDADLLILSHRAGLRISEVPAIFHEDPTGRSIHSGISPLYYVYKMFLSIIVTMLRRRPQPEDTEPHGP